MSEYYSRRSRQARKGDWRTSNFCAIDLETTGLNLDQDEIIAIGVTQIVNGRIITENNFYSQVKPLHQPSTSSTKIHGLRTIDLEASPSMSMTIPALREATRDRVIIAHAAWVERAFLDRQAKGIFPKRVLDTALLAKSLGVAAQTPGQEPSLEFLARRLGVPVYAPHNALGDAMTTSVVFLALVNLLERESRKKNVPLLTLQMIWDKAKQ
ncbi:MAG: 3'-5' exonuclease [Actinomycetes bacterium]